MKGCWKEKSEADLHQSSATLPCARRSPLGPSADKLEVRT